MKDDECERLLGTCSAEVVPLIQRDPETHVACFFFGGKNEAVDLAVGVCEPRCEAVASASVVGAVCVEVNGGETRQPVVGEHVCDGVFVERGHGRRDLASEAKGNETWGQEVNKVGALKWVCWCLELWVVPEGGKREVLKLVHVADDLLCFLREYLVAYPDAGHVEREMPGLGAHFDAVEE